MLRVNRGVLLYVVLLLFAAFCVTAADYSPNGWGAMALVALVLAPVCWMTIDVLKR